VIIMFGNRLKQLRCQKNILQKDLAEKLSVSKSTVGMWETDSREPDLKMLVKIADYFNVSLDYLLGRTESPLTVSGIQTGDINGNHSANNWTVNSKNDDITEEFIKVFKELDFSDKIEVMSFAMQKKKKEEE